MNDRVEQSGQITRAGAREAAEKRLQEAKRAFSDAALAALNREPGATERVDKAMADVNKARAGLRQCERNANAPASA